MARRLACYRSLVIDAKRPTCRQRESHSRSSLSRVPARRRPQPMPDSVTRRWRLDGDGLDVAALEAAMAAMAAGPAPLDDHLAELDRITAESGIAPVDRSWTRAVELSAYLASEEAPWRLDSLDDLPGLARSGPIERVHLERGGAAEVDVHLPTNVIEVWAANVELASAIEDALGDMVGGRIETARGTGPRPVPLTELSPPVTEEPGRWRLLIRWARANKVIAGVMTAAITVTLSVAANGISKQLGW